MTLLNSYSVEIPEYPRVQLYGYSLWQALFQHSSAMGPLAIHYCAQMQQLQCLLGNLY